MMYWRRPFDIRDQPDRLQHAIGAEVLPNERLLWLGQPRRPRLMLQKSRPC